MKASKRILLYGNSVVLGSIGASLNRFSEYEVVTLKLPQKESIWLGPAIIDILIFDSQKTRPEEVMCFLRADSALLRIGIDPTSIRSNSGPAGRYGAVNAGFA